MKYAVATLYLEKGAQFYVSAILDQRESLLVCFICGTDSFGEYCSQLSLLDYCRLNFFTKVLWQI